MICVFGHRAASEADRVVKALRAADANVVRINTGADEALAAVVAGEPGRVVGRVRCDGREFDTDAVKAAWLHQLPPLAQGPRPPMSVEAALSSRLNLWNAVARTIGETFWLNPPWRVRAAANKHIQLTAATAAGLAVPATVIGDLPTAIRGLGSGRTVAKFFGDSGRLWNTGTGLASLTVDVDLSTASDQELANIPLLHQVRLEARQEYRAVLIGEEAFAAVCDKPEGATDIRDTPGLPDYRAAELPEAVRAGLVALTGSLGLAYCSADLAVDADGHWFFLDLNATGAFWWVDDLHDRAVTKSLAAALIAVAS